MGACCSDEIEPERTIVPRHEDDFPLNAVAPHEAPVENLEYLPSRLGLFGIWTLKVLDENYVLEIDDNTATLRPQSLVIPIDATVRELREEEEGVWSVYMALTFYQPAGTPDAWRNGPPGPMLLNFKLSQRCFWEPDVNGWRNSLDTVNAMFQRDEDAQPVSIEARRNGNSEKLSKLRDAGSFKAKGDSPRSYIYGGGSETTECPLCFEDFDDDEHMPMVTPCKHVWCSSCIIAVCQLAPPHNCGECPTCRKPVHLENIMRRSYL